MLSLQAPWLFSPHSLIDLADGAFTSPNPTTLTLTLAKDATWFGTSDPSLTYETAYEHLDAVLRQGPSATQAFLARSLFPAARIATLLLVAGRDSAHRRLELAREAEIAAATVARLMPFLFEPPAARRSR